MPGFLENTLHQGYGYLEQTGYVDYARPYVEKARNVVPLMDYTVKKAEEIVPPLITKADALAEPQIDKMRPYVEPRYEQVKETVTPYVNKGVEKYGSIKTETLKKVEEIKDFKDAKTTQIKDIKDAKLTQIKELTDPQVAKIKGAVQQGEGFLVARKEQAQKLLRVPKSADLQGLKCETVLGKVACMLDKAEGFLDKYLPLPKTGENKDSESEVSTASCASDSSIHRINHSLTGIKSRVLFAFMIKVRMLLSTPEIVKTYYTTLKTSYTDGSLKEKSVKYVTDIKETSVKKVTDTKEKSVKYVTDIKSSYLDGSLKEKSVKYVTDIKEKSILKVTDIKEKSVKKVTDTKDKSLKYVTDTKSKMISKVSVKLEPVIEKLAPTVAAVAQNGRFKKTLEFAIAGSVKVIGKEKTTTILTMIKSYIPSTWKVSASPRDVAETKVIEGKKYY